MAKLVGLKDQYQLAFGNDTDSDRHGIVTPSMGLMNPNHSLAVAIQYLFSNRGWPARAEVGKTLVSSALIDRVARKIGRTLREVPVGFKWFVDGLLDGSLGFGGEESAGASFLRRDGSAWTTDKDGLIPCLLAAEMTARGGEDPGEVDRGLVRRFGEPAHRRRVGAARPLADRVTSSSHSAQKAERSVARPRAPRDLYSHDGRDLDWFGLRRLPDRRCGRAGRDGPCVPGDPDGAQTAGGAQGDRAG